MMTCKGCGYQWEPRVPEPKACPRCKRRQDLDRQLINELAEAVAPAVKRAFDKIEKPPA